MTLHPISLLSQIVSPFATYFELTVSEPCRTIKKATREKRVFADRVPQISNSQFSAQQISKRRFSLWNLIKRQRAEAASDANMPTPMIHIASVKEHYYRDWN